MQTQLSADAAPVLLAMAVLVGAVVSPGQAKVRVTLSHVSTVYLPEYGADGSPSFSFPTATVEQMAVDAASKLMYAVGDGVIHVIDASNITSLTSKHHVILSDLELTDVEVCGEGVFVSYNSKTNVLQGGVRVYNKYNRQTGAFTLARDISLGNNLPDMLKPTPDCTLVVALENEGKVQGGQFSDLPGRVGIIRFPSGIGQAPQVKLLDFTHFDAQFNTLSAAGVRWVYRGSGAKFSDDVEPEYVAFNSDHTKAYICLQENNAIAVVDMASDNITDIYGLGFKRWGELDPSDSDGGVHIAEWPVYGMYQPDSIEWVHWNDRDYLITANEGSAMDYSSPIDFDEEIRGNSIADSDIADTVSGTLKEALRDDAKLGRLKFSKVDGKNSEDKFEKFYTFGARGFSIWRTSDMAQVFDTGSQMEKESGKRRPDIFNSNADGDNFLSQTVDTRSDDRGPETESVVTGVLEDHLLIFAGNERPGTIAVYSVAPGGMDPQFQTLFTGGIPQQTDRTWGQMYDDRKLFGIDPEYIEFLPVSKGLADYPVLVVLGAVSGTVSILKVEVKDDPSGMASSLVSPDLLMLVTCLLFLLHGRCAGQRW